MANYEVKVYDHTFQRTGVYPTFDENKFGRLLDTFAPDAPQTTFWLNPHPAWGRRNPRTWLDIAFDFVRDPYDGTYNPGTNRATVRCYPNLSKTNDILRHETQHLIATAMSSEDASSERLARREAQTCGGAVLAGIGISTALALTDTADPGWATAIAVPAGVLMYHAHRNAPHEVAPREFTSMDLTSWDNPWT